MATAAEAAPQTAAAPIEVQKAAEPGASSTAGPHPPRLGCP